jgi:hypothetical protein
MTTALQFTLYRNKTPVGKTMIPGVKDKPLYDADASSILVDDFSKLLALLTNLTPNHAISAGFFKPDYGQQVRVVSAAGKALNPNGVQRSDQTMEWTKGNGLCIFDIDLKAHRGDGYLLDVRTCADVRKLLVSLDPAFANVGMLIRPSSSSYIDRNGERVEFYKDSVRPTEYNLSGVHVYIALSDGAKVPEVTAHVNNLAKTALGLPTLCDM